MRIRSSDGEIPHARLIARAKARGDLYPLSRDNSLIATLGAEARMLLTLSSRTLSRKSLNFSPLTALTAFWMVRRLTCNARDNSASEGQGLSCNA